MRPFIVYSLLFFTWITFGTAAFAQKKKKFSPVNVRVINDMSSVKPCKLDLIEVIVKLDTLWVTIKVNKKIKEKDLYLYTNGMYQESFPPQLKLYMASLKQIPTKGRSTLRNISVPISSLKYEGSDKLILWLDNYPEKLVYQY